MGKINTKDFIYIIILPVLLISTKLYSKVQEIHKLYTDKSAQNHPKSEILFDENISPRDLCKMTLC